LYVYLSKILPVFVMPLSVVFLLAVLALIFLRYNKRRTSAGFLLLALVILAVSSMPFVAGMLYRNIESKYPPMPMAAVPTGGCIIVLGGAVGAPIPPRVILEFNEAIDRVYLTAKLYHAGKAPMVVVTGGNQPWSESKTAEADLIRDVLMEWGVPKDAIFLEGSSRNTRENALYSKNLLDAISCVSPLLVTSAAHMPRAVSAFNSVGVSVTPVSSDVRVVNQHIPVIMDFVPNAGALAMSSEAIREWVGQKVYSWNGWN